MNTPRTEDQLAAEHAYRMTERLGILCGSATPTPEQEALARAEADEAVRRLRTPPTPATAP